MRWSLFAVAAASCLFVSAVGSAQEEEAEEAATEGEGEAAEGEDAGGEGEEKTEDEKKSDEADKDEPEAAEEPTYSHARQFGLRAGLVGGFRMYFRYDQSPLCRDPVEVAQDNSRASPFVEDDQPANCGFLAPLATEIALSFAPLGSVEPYLWTRLGFTDETKTDTAALVMVGVGARLYTMSDSQWKLFIEPAAALEVEGEGDNDDAAYEALDAADGAFDPEWKQDIVFHLAIGPQVDLHKNFGIYLAAGMDVGVLRAIHGWMFANLGVQGRGP